MSDTIIRVENLGKKFAIARQVEREAVRATLRDALTEGTKSLARKLRRSGIGTRAKREEFWALKDVSFEVKRGECVGIIGRNGSGKSTLLKILSRITEPTTGRIELRGRVASLLEVGTGFHAELTGRENIYLNGAILGMTRAEIRKKFDEIVAFAEVEKFLDTPVKHYSSGMYVRLAFAVAAHLDPEILIVDEVLAVGDAAFQKKCLGKMGDAATNEGKTVLFVSHNMATIQNLCHRVALLKQGMLEIEGYPIDVIHHFINKETMDWSNINLLELKSRKGIGDLRFSRIEFIDKSGLKTNSILCGEYLKIRLHFFCKIKDSLFKNCRVGVRITNPFGASIVLSTEMVRSSEINLASKSFIDFIIPKLPLSQGNYFITLFAESNGNIQDWLIDFLSFSVDGGDFYGSGKQCPQGHEGKSILIDFYFNQGQVNEV